MYIHHPCYCIKVSPIKFSDGWIVFVGAENKIDSSQANVWQSKGICHKTCPQSPNYLLPTCSKINESLSTICFSFMSGTCPQCLPLILHSIHSRNSLCHSPVQTQKHLGKYLFFYPVPSVWNSLPQMLWHTDSSCSLKTTLKTNLFSNFQTFLQPGCPLPHA